MACTNVPRMLVDRPVPSPDTLPNGLLATATVVEDMDPHGIHGVEYVALCDPNVKPYPVGECADDPRPNKTADRSEQIVHADAFALYAAEACPATGPALAAARDQLTDRFLAGEQHTLEAVINNGWVGARPFLRDPDSDIIATDPLPLATAIGILEHRMATLGLPAVIHAPRWMAQQVPALVRETGQLFTRLGSRIVFGSGYDGAPPFGLADDENTWLYATGPITLSRSALIYPADASSGAFDPATNTTFALMERVYVIDWPCQVVAVPTTVPNPGPLFPLPALPPDLVVEPSQGSAPMEVTATVDNHGNGPVVVDFGDGSDPVVVEDGASVTHTYAEPGNYTVTAAWESDPTQRTTQHVNVTAPAIDPVQDLTATGGDEQITLDWGWEGDDPDSFQVQYRAGSSEEWLDGPAMGPQDRTATLENLEPDTTYQVRIRPIVGTFMGPWATAQATTDEVVPLAAPTGVEATDLTAESATIDWTWDQGQGPEAESFEITYTGPDGSTTLTADAQDRSVPVEGLTPNSAYTVVVTAIADDERAESTPYEFSTPPGDLNPPTEVAAAQTADQDITVSWTWSQGQGPDVNDFTVTATPDQGEPLVANVAGADREATLTGAQPNTTYTVTVTAHSTDADAVSEPVTLTTDPGPLAAPTGVEATDVTTDSATIGWTWAQGDGPAVESFTVTVDDQEVEVADPEARTAAVADLEPGTEYTATVTAHAGDEDAASDPATFTTDAVPLAAPTDVAATDITPTSATIGWTWAQGDGPAVESFTVTVDDQALDINDPAARTSTVADLEPGTEYTATVTAHAGDEDAASDLATFTTDAVPLAAPTNLQASTTAADSLGLTWEFDAGQGPNPSNFAIRYRTPASTGTWVEGPEPAGDAREATLDDLEPETEYEVELTAVTEASSSAPITTTATTTA